MLFINLISIWDPRLREKTQRESRFWLTVDGAHERRRRSGRAWSWLLESKIFLEGRLYTILSTPFPPRWSGGFKGAPRAVRRPRGEKQYFSLYFDDFWFDGFSVVYGHPGVGPYVKSRLNSRIYKGDFYPLIFTLSGFGHFFKNWFNKKFKNVKIKPENPPEALTPTPF